MTRKTKVVLAAAILGFTSIVALFVFATVLFLSQQSSSGSRVPSNTTSPSPLPPRLGPSPTPDYDPDATELVIDKILERMDWGNIAFNAPTKMKLDAPATIQLVLSPSDSAEELKKLITAEGDKEAAHIRISERMEAHLSGTAFRISTITPEPQAVTWNQPTEWKWEVQPTQYGRHNLHLTLTAIITVKGSSMPRTIRTFDKTIEVEVSSWQRGFLLFRENWEWMWTLLALPIGAWLWRTRQINKKSPNVALKQTRKRRRK